jgi:hypothetical protein
MAIQSPSPKSHIIILKKTKRKSLLDFIYSMEKHEDDAEFAETRKLCSSLLDKCTIIELKLSCGEN